MRPVIYTATAADVANGFTPPIPVDYNRVNGQYGIKYTTSTGGAGIGTVQISIDDPFNPPSFGMGWAAVVLANNMAFVNGAASAFRLATPALGDIITVRAQGGSPAG